MIFKKSNYKSNTMTALLFIIEIIFCIIFWVLMTIFCVIKSFSQMHWFICGWVNLAFTYAMTFSFIFILTLLRYIGVKCKNKSIYNIELMLRYLI